MSHYCVAAGRNQGSAVFLCREESDGSFVVTNGEYESPVNFCPYCGAKAPKQASTEEERARVRSILSELLELEGRLAVLPEVDCDGLCTEDVLSCARSALLYGDVEEAASLLNELTDAFGRND